MLIHQVQLTPARCNPNLEDAEWQYVHLAGPVMRGKHIPKSGSVQGRRRALNRSRFRSTLSYWVKAEKAGHEVKVKTDGRKITIELAGMTQIVERS